MNPRLLAPLFATLLLACRRDPVGPPDPEAAREVAGTTTITGANGVAAKENDDAVLQIVEARCSREVSCNTMGSHPWASKEGCLQEMKTRLEGELKPARCPSGIDQNSLGLCLDSIRNESCGSPMETLARASACRTTKLCLSARDPD